jgi:hypothetical protein
MLGPLAWVETPMKPASLATTRLAECWTHGLDITGPAGAFCRVAAQRLAPEGSGLVAHGPLGAAALRVLRTYAA